MKNDAVVHKYHNELFVYTIFSPEKKILHIERKKSCVSVLTPCMKSNIYAHHSIILCFAQPHSHRKKNLLFPLAEKLDASFR